MDAGKLGVGGTTDDDDAGKIHPVPLIEDETGDRDQPVRQRSRGVMAMTIFG